MRSANCGARNDKSRLKTHPAFRDPHSAFSAAVDSPQFRTTVPIRIRRGSQVVRPRSAKPLFAGSIPAPASPVYLASGGRSTSESTVIDRQRLEKLPLKLIDVKSESKISRGSCGLITL